ncbi:hypothetical protein [Paenibacillus glycanilyticus]|uniref:Lipoprotein n=1 Tax=Paenibacillus glycanilyticus TaxID=126569 RepID=A0ABQ6G6B5_9BACL|nr:hypothetical protein [Paenibacillus glycanilyticus]GLX66519.1 hypothetical protein MU1_08630 [Paenibacillus glycanilyticus]
MYKFAGFVLLLILVLAGCSESTSLMKEVDRPNKDVKSFVDRNGSKNGIYLYTAPGKGEYVIVNDSTVQQGEPAKLVTDALAELQDGVLTIHFDVTETSDLQDERIKPVSVYKLNNNMKADTIKVVVNGEETSFETSGN